MLNRRNIIGGAAALPIIAAVSCSAIPAAALTPAANRHGAWLAQRSRLLDYANSVDCESKAFDHACTALSGLERRIMQTAAANIAEAKAKLQFAAHLDAEGSMLTAEDAAKLLSDIAPFLAGER
ncbi:hypothetical protein D9601_19360 [Sphingomonas sp. MA1305]|uniref:hypothetical protein n=1 Tax=Sphingomonas sp. MA1305 TaxID=2479204 RepID=UPI0018E01CC5|nr:hypothetical protein [Sphingomonas sp. MA1305]MBI0477497.1 hypothetical protein [Sphingomonas sp. MA1305]